MGGNEYRVLNVPRARLYSSVGSGGFGPGSALYVFDTIDYDTDNMTSAGNSSITIRTPGVYSVHAIAGFDSGTGARWSQILVNSDTARSLASVATTSSSAFGPNHTLHGQYPLKAGDTLGLWLQANTDAAVMGAGRYRTCLAACLISTL